jgi:hypothetical protein
MTEGEDLVRLSSELNRVIVSGRVTATEAREFLRDGLAANASLRLGALVDQFDDALTLVYALRDYIDRHPTAPKPT